MSGGGAERTRVYKDNLIALAADQAWNEITLPDLAATGWRDAATAMAVSLHAMLTRHPWLLQAFGSFLLSGPGKARHDDHTLAIYEAAGFSGTQADQAAATVFAFVLGNALGTAADASLNRKLSREGGNAEELIRDHVAKATEIAAQFPRLRARLDNAVGCRHHHHQKQAAGSQLTQYLPGIALAFIAAAWALSVTAAAARHG